MTGTYPEKYKAFIFLGAPGCGKGTQGQILGAIPRFYHFSMGDAFRSMDTRTPIGQEFIAYSRKGELVPDELTIRYFKKQIDARADLHMFKPDIDILILDGIPRSIEQARILEEHIEVLQLFHLSCPDREELITRIRKRALKEGRMDDASDEIIQRRIRAYEESTRDLVDHYSDRRAAINAAQAPVKVTRDILSVIVAHPEWLHHTGEE
ncbi:MAG: nucleoside monophosphate kinase [Verrucomicrobiales bacterium]|nr:nucleoside monophosphate kinase [Verrucomicrobiales bacterium]HAP77974.1 adenylate kinase [Acidimicrobiaceae bacterium]